jgi:hypothetical protein
LSVLWLLYGLFSAALLATTWWTGRRATLLTGKDHYLLTRTRVFVEVASPPQDEADAAFDEALREAGESPALLEERPLFVLGLLDGSLPLIAAGAGLLGAVWIRRRSRAECGAGEGISAPGAGRDGHGEV